MLHRTSSGLHSQSARHSVYNTSITKLDSVLSKRHQVDTSLTRWCFIKTSPAAVAVCEDPSDKNLQVDVICPCCW